MRRMFAVAATLFACSAWGQTWSNDQFTVSTDNLTFVSIVDGTVFVQYLPYAESNPASGSYFPPDMIDLDFTPKAGYSLAGELISFSVDLQVDTSPLDVLVGAVAGYNVDINGEYAQSATDSGGSAHYAGTHFLRSPNLVSEIDESVAEGIACPVGDEGNGCNYGIDLIFLEAQAQLSSFTVTPILTPVPEPDTRALWMGGLALLAASSVAGRLARRTEQRWRLD